MAGVSPSVVSYVLNDGPRPVAEETRQRVLDAVERLGYRPNGMARSLRLRRSMTIGLIVPDNSNPFFAELARAVEDAAFDHGYTMILGNAMEDDDRLGAYLQAFMDRMVDGLIVIPNHGDADWVDDVIGSGMPFVAMDRSTGRPDVDTVLVDNHQGACMAVEHLIEHGRRRIACVSGPAELAVSSERVSGHRLALERHDVDPKSSPVVQADFGREGGRQAILQLLGSQPDIDAVFCTSDEQAIGVLRGASDAGRTVPSDLALCSFDGISATLFTNPTITTAVQPFDDLGRLAVMRVLAGTRAGGPRVKLLPMAMRLGESCGCRPRAPGAHH